MRRAPPSIIIHQATLNAAQQTIQNIISRINSFIADHQIDKFKHQRFEAGENKRNQCEHYERQEYNYHAVQYGVTHYSQAQQPNGYHGHYPRGDVLVFSQKLFHFVHTTSIRSIKMRYSPTQVIAPSAAKKRMAIAIGHIQHKLIKPQNIATATAANIFRC